MHHPVKRGLSCALVASCFCLTRVALAADTGTTASASPASPTTASTSVANDSAPVAVPEATSTAPATVSSSSAAASPAAPAQAPDAGPAPGTANADTSSSDADFYEPTSMSSEPEVAAYPKLDLSGFTDFSFAANVSSKSSPLRNIIQPYPSFSVGNLNLYLSAALAAKLHLLAEVRFLYLPQGNEPFPSSIGTAYAPYDATALDYADDGRPLNWGGIEIERVQIDYAFTQLLNFRVGQWLTPVGIWNVDHGSPTVIGVYRPYVVGQGMFPERQTGIQISGEWEQDVHTVDYAVTVSNGRGPSDAYADLDNNKALGARLAYTNNALGTLTVGVSAYDGTYASRNKEYSIDTTRASPAIIGTNPLTLQYHERALGADARFQLSGLLLQGELMEHEVVFQNDVRPFYYGSLQANYREVGYYVLAGYRTDWLGLGIMPFAMFEGLNFASQPVAAPGIAESVGLNIRPVPTLVLKLQFHSTQLGSDTSVQPYHGVLNRILTQVAVAF